MFLHLTSILLNCLACAMASLLLVSLGQITFCNCSKNFILRQGIPSLKQQASYERHVAIQHIAQFSTLRPLAREKEFY